MNNKIMKNNLKMKITIYNNKRRYIFPRVFTLYQQFFVHTYKILNKYLE